MGVIISEHKSAALPSGAADGIELLAKVAAVGCGTELSRRRETIEVAPEDYIDNASHGIRAIECRCTIWHDLDPVDRR